MLDVGRLGFSLHCQLIRHYGAVARVEIEVVPGVVRDLGSIAAAVVVLDEVDLTEQVALVVAANLVALGDVRPAVPAGEAVGVEQRITDLPRLISLREDQLACGAARPEHSVEILLAVELAELGEARGGERGSAGRALQTVLVERAVAYPEHKLVLNLPVTLTTDFHIRHPLVSRALSALVTAGFTTGPKLTAAPPDRGEAAGQLGPIHRTPRLRVLTTSGWSGPAKSINFSTNGRPGRGFSTNHSRPASLASANLSCGHSKLRAGSILISSSLSPHL